MTPTPQEFRPCPVHPGLQQLLVWVTGPSANIPRVIGVTPAGAEWGMFSVARPPGGRYAVLGRWPLAELRWYAEPQAWTKG